MRNRIDVKLASNEKDYLKWISRPNQLSHKIFDSDLDVIPESKVKLTLNKPAYIGMCIFDLNKVLMYEFYCDCCKNKYRNNSRLLCLIYGIVKLKMFMTILARQINAAFW